MNNHYRNIASLAWPVLIGQWAVMIAGVIDTIMAGRTSATDVAAVGLGASIFITVHVALLGIVLGLSPIIAQNYGARRLPAIGINVTQGLWLAFFLAIPGCIALAWTEPWLRLSQPPAEVAVRTQQYLWAVAAGLPAALLFRVYSALNNATSRPKVVMIINLIELVLKVPLNALFIGGWYADQPGAWFSIPALGGPGCGVATALIEWVTAIVAMVWLVRDPWYRQFHLFKSLAPAWNGLKELLRIGLPIGASYAVEITSFTFIALFVARFGAHVGASNQIASNVAGVCYMVILSISNATSVLTAQAIGAGSRQSERRIVYAGFRMLLIAAATIALLLWLFSSGVAAIYTRDPQVIALTVPLLTLVAMFHVFDAMQTFFASVLRAYKVATLPTVVYILALWGVGLGGGWWLTFAPPAGTWLAQFSGESGGAAGFWVAGIASLVVAAIGLAMILAATWRRRSAAAAAAALAAASGAARTARVSSQPASR